MQPSTPHAAERNIVIVGGGFAGTTLAQRLERLLPPPWRVVLVSQESYTTFNPMLAEVVGASVFPEHVIAPIRQMVGRTRFIMATVTGVDFKRRLVAGDTLAGPREIHYEHLVFAFGTRANLSIVPGMAEHALPLKLVGDAMFIRNRILQRVARIELESDPETRRRLGHFVVVGGASRPGRRSWARRGPTGATSWRATRPPTWPGSTCRSSSCRGRRTARSAPSRTTRR
jgi:NADH dehydrogenase